MNRIPCSVPFCRRTAKDDGRYSEIICGKHWPAVDRRLRWLCAAWKRRARRGHPLAPVRLVTLWERCKRQAIERAAGLE